jgi:hypothetical protein
LWPEQRLLLNLLLQASQDNSAVTVGFGLESVTHPQLGIVKGPARDRDLMLA